MTVIKKIMEIMNITYEGIFIKCPTPFPRFNKTKKHGPEAFPTGP